MAHINVLRFPSVLHRKPVLGLAVGIAALIIYGITLPRVITFEDAGLFDAVCATGGIAHPPGYPLFTLICTPVFQLPFDPILIGNGLSAVFAAATTLVLVMLLLELGCSRLAAAIGGVALAVSTDFWSQAIIVEVYSLNTLLFTLTLFACVRFYNQPSVRVALLTCFCFALGVSNHWPLMFLSFPGLAVICLSRWSWVRGQLFDVRFLLLVAASVLLGLLPYLSLLLKQDPLISHSGPIANLHEFWRYVSREAYQKSDHHEAASFYDKIQFAQWITVKAATQLSVLLLPFTVLGALWIRPVALRVGLAAIFIGNTYVLIGLLDFDYEFETMALFRPYPLIAWTCVAIWTAFGADAVLARLAHRKAARYGVSILLGVGLLASLHANFKVNDRSGAWLADDFSGTILASMPEGANLVVSSDAISFSVLYKHYVAGVRPDVTLYHFENGILPRHIKGNSIEARVGEVLQLGAQIPTFSAGVVELPVEVDYGLYIQHGVGTGPAVDIDPRISAFRHRLVAAYVAGTLTDPHELIFANELLIGISTQLLGRARAGTMTADEARDLAALQTTFPGVIMTLYNALTVPDLEISGEGLVAMALHMEADLPSVLSNQERAMFYYYLGALFTEGRHGIAPDAKLASAFLQRGFGFFPVRAYSGLCMMLRLGVPLGHPANQPAFRAHCEGGRS